MEIKLQIFGRVFSIYIGRKTLWFDQVDFITITEEWYYKKEVTYASMIFHFWRDKKFKI